MKISIILFTIFVSVAGWAKTNIKSEFNVIPLNSPVKESTAKFLLKAPKDLVIKDIRFKVTPATDLIQKDNHHTQTKLINTPKGKELHIPMADSKIGFYRLYVIIKTNRAEHQFQTADLDYVKFVYEKNLKNVPEPNSEVNNSTLLGIDSDNDGIRDDVQIWINQKTTNDSIRLALRQYSIGINNRFASIDKKSLSITAIYESLRGQNCLNYMLMENGTSNQEIIQTVVKLETLHKNTRQRIQAADQLSLNFHGQLIKRVDKELACDF